ncbi:MAG: 30S ribosomal protein S12 methylthiotransferase RimO [Candidatus Omnitrophica bacterium]|nr:30S ribosomal protein S12 methylthiotransferase RimO [Candidatus Omnitrophota bacterium]
MKIGYVSLGCARNLVDLEVMLGMLRQHQYELTLDPEKSDILIINTCSFIQEAVEESIDTILQAVEWKRKGKIRKLVVSGCLPQRYQGDLQSELQQVDAFLGSGEQNRIVGVIESLAKEKESPTQWPSPKFLYAETSPRFPLTPSHTAYVKISEGCLNDCSFCIIPKIRGVYRERPIESILEEVKHLSKTRPLKEINLIGQDTSLYGKRLYREKRLPELLRRLSQSNLVPWIRILYLHPAHFTEGLMEVFRTEKNLCPYIDIPIQHASDSILSSMKRECTQDQMRAKFLRLREEFPDFILRTSVMVGYPGETEGEFETLLDFIREIRFDRLGTFLFSREEGTAASLLPNQIPQEVKQRRYEEVMSLQREISKERLTRFVGKTLEVLIEEVDPQDATLWVGRSRGDAPEVDGQVFVHPVRDEVSNGVHGNALKIGKIVPVQIQDSYDYDLVGDAV